MSDKVTQAASGIADAAFALQEGKAIVIPTDTVYGLAVAVKYAEGPDLLFRIKGRKRDKPVAWLIASYDDLALYGTNVPAYASRLAHDRWPGPLTLVVEASERVPEAFRADDGTVGLRVPEDAMARAVIMRARSPLATTSANMSGAEAPSDFDSVDPAIIAQVSIVLEDEDFKGGVASTVVDCTGDRPSIVRNGPITAEEIEAYA